MGKVKNLKGERFGKLTAIEFVGIGNRHYAMWRCTCDCGNECITSADVLTRKTNHSCGCLAKEHLKEMSKNNITHGMTGSRLLGCYKAMLKDFPAEYGYLLSSAALSACPKNTVIADIVIENIVHRKSYRKISKERYIPMNPKDFYGYRRKTVAVLYERMRLLGVWEDER